MTARRERDLAKYKQNPNVEKITDSNISFTKEFKLRAVNAYKSGESPESIFIDAGIVLSDFERCYARKTISRWMRIISKHGVKNINKERRGLGSSGRPSEGKRFKSLEEEIAYLRAENDFLKKLRALEKKYVEKKSSK